MATGDKLVTLAGLKAAYDNGVHIDGQTLTLAQQAQARANIGAADEVKALLTADDIPDTVQEITFDSSGNVAQITHKKRTDTSVTVRTDVFTFSSGTITEARTLSSGESLTIVTNTDTLATTLTYAAA